MFLEEANVERKLELDYSESRLEPATASLAKNFPAVCAFVNDDLGRTTLELLAESGTRYIALRCSGYNNVDLTAAAELGLTVVRVPGYSPHAVAEHTIALMLTLNRHTHRAWSRVREGNFALDGLLGFDLYGRSAGLVGVGRIGAAVARILRGFGCRVVGYDPVQTREAIDAGVEFVPMEELLEVSDIISLHCPLTPATCHLIDDVAIERMKHGVMLINTSRGAVVDTSALIRGLKTGRIGYLGLDVYEEEAGLFFQDCSGLILQDDVLARLLTFPNVLVTGHQGFFTREALRDIASTTLDNLVSLARTGDCENRVSGASVPG